MHSGGLFASLGTSPSTRKWLFYTVCITVRTFLAVAVAVWGGSETVEIPMAITLAVILSLVTLVNLLKNNKVWWTRKIHAAILGSAAITSLISAILPGHGIYLVVSGFLFSDVVYGLADSWIQNPFLS